MQALSICLLISRTAKGGTGMVQLAGQYLNLVLEDLKLNRNLKVNRVTQNIIVTPTTQYGPYTLESDYLRTYDLFYPLPTSGGATSGGLTQFLTPITMEQFDAEFKDPSLANYPWEFATDLSTSAQTWSGGSFGNGTLTSAGQMFIYPQTSGTITMTHRYMKNQLDITTPETSTVVPWFAFTEYLIHKSAAYLMGVTGDSREAEYHAESEKMLQPYLIMEGDEQQTVRNVRLDPRHFRFGGALKKTKASPL